jgi:hypothetical protein
LPAATTFGHRVFHVLRREELALLDVHHAPGLGGSDDQVGLAGEERGNLQHVGHGADGRACLGVVDVGQHGHTERVASPARAP